MDHAWATHYLEISTLLSTHWPCMNHALLTHCPCVARTCLERNLPRCGRRYVDCWNIIMMSVDRFINSCLNDNLYPNVTSSWSSVGDKESLHLVWNRHCPHHSQPLYLYHPSTSIGTAATKWLHPSVASESSSYSDSNNCPNVLHFLVVHDTAPHQDQTKPKYGCT